MFLEKFKLFSVFKIRELKSLLNYFFFRKTNLRRLERYKSIPETLYIECVNLCNARCVFCMYPKIKDGLSKKTMSLGFFQTILEEFKSVGGKHIALTPAVADPLVDQFFSERLEVIERLGFESVSFYTNLIGLNDGHLKELSKTTLSVRISISLTGFDEDAYARLMGVRSFSKVLRNLRRISKSLRSNSNIDMQVILRRYRGDEASFRDLRTFLTGLPIKYESQIGFDSWGGELRDEIRKNPELMLMPKNRRVGPCSISFSKPLVTVNGLLKACDCRDAHNDLVMGDLSCESLTDIWNGKNFKKFRDSFYNPTSLPKVCRNCEHYVSIFE